MAPNGVTKYIGKTGLYAHEGKLGFRTRVKILDAKAQFGRIDVLASPTDGDGSKWVSLQNITLDEAV